MSVRRNKSTPRSAKNPPPRRRFRWSHIASFAVGIVCAGVALQLASQTASGRLHLGLGLIEAKAHAKPDAPWGKLEYTTFHLERPDEQQVVNGPSAPPARWLFDNMAEADVQKFLSAPDLTSEQVRHLLDKSHWTRAGNGWQIMPPDDVVVSLSLTARERIYAVLRQNPANQLYFFPLCVAAAKFEQWMDDSGLPEDLQTLIRKLAYPRGQSLCLSDFAVIEAHCTPAQKKLLAKAVSRNPALLMKLRITADSDLDALVRYWGRAGRMKAMKPLLESLAHNPDGGTLNVSAFLPEFARMRLYTYPDPESDPVALREDCFWTALNFFNEEPDNRYLVNGTQRSAIKENYTEVKTNWAFGDLIVLLEGGKEAKHVCIYIADDVVFTKNGADIWAPWTLMKMPDMMTRYTSDQAMQLVVLRRKGT